MLPTFCSTGETALRTWRGSAYTSIQAELKTGVPGVWQDTIKALDAATARTPLAKTGTVVRGETLKERFGITADNLGSIVGKRFESTRFMAPSMHDIPPYGFGTAPYISLFQQVLDVYQQKTVHFIGKMNKKY